MSRVDEYRAKLRARKEWEPFLMSESRLPGPRGNLELLAAVAEEGSTAQFLAMVERTEERAPSGTPGEFVVACGAAGLGESIARGDGSLWPRLRSLANDSRWRVREGAAMGLQRIGDRDMDGLLRHLGSWMKGGPLERRAVVAAPTEGRKRFERWAESDDPDIQWIVRENLKKKWLERMDARWVRELRKGVLTGPGA